MIEIFSSKQVEQSDPRLNTIDPDTYITINLLLLMLKAPSVSSPTDTPKPMCRYIQPALQGGTIYFGVVDTKETTPSPEAKQFLQATEAHLSRSRQQELERSMKMHLGNCYTEVQQFPQTFLNLGPVDLAAASHSRAALLIFPRFNPAMDRPIANLVASALSNLYCEFGLWLISLIPSELLIGETQYLTPPACVIRHIVQEDWYLIDRHKAQGNTTNRASLVNAYKRLGFQPPSTKPN